MSTNPLKRLREYLSDYCHFSDHEIVRPLSLWIAGTYIFEAFDAYPYLVITANTKRAGKTRCSELIGFTTRMPMNVAGASAAALFRAVKFDKPTIINDEAESLSSESASIMRTFLNVGYRKGQTIPRADGKRGIIQWPTYCPKVFVLIGDVYDTLKDRSIVITMERAEPRKRFNYEQAKAEGAEIAEEIKMLIAENMEEITKQYESEAAAFLTDRDAEIWRPILAIGNVCETVSADNPTLTRIAVDLATEKTMPKRTYAMQGDADKHKEREQYALRLLKDLLAITENISVKKGKIVGNKNGIQSVEAVRLLKAIDVAPWRKYHGESNETPADGEGLNANTMATLLAIFSVRPKVIRDGENVFRGYSKKDIIAAAKKAGVK